MAGRTALMTAAAASLLLMPQVVRTQTKAAGGEDDLEYIEIRQLVARYPFAVDTGGNNGYDYAISSRPTASSCVPIRKERGGAGPWRVSSAPPTSCNTSRIIIEPTAEGAIGKEYLFELVQPPAP
jgi:hypothetical protein